MKKNKLRLPVKVIGAAAIVALALFFILAYFAPLFKTSDYFKIKDIVIYEADKVGGQNLLIANPGYSQNIDLSYLKRKNIFSLDLREESRNILEAYPNYGNVKLVRVLPNRIFVNFIKRKPLALVKLYRYFALDENGVFFYSSDKPEEVELPIISGLETKVLGPKPGKSYNIKELLIALTIIREAKRNSVLKSYKIRKIDVVNPSEASIYIPYLLKGQGPLKGQMVVGLGDLEVKVGSDSIKNKMEILAQLIIAAKNDFSNIKYIDLRFKEPVVKFKDVK